MNDRSDELILSSLLLSDRSDCDEGSIDRLKIRGIGLFVSGLRRCPLQYRIYRVILRGTVCNGFAVVITTIKNGRVVVLLAHARNIAKFVEQTRTNFDTPIVGNGTIIWSYCLTPLTWSVPYIGEKESPP